MTLEGLTGLAENFTPCIGLNKLKFFFIGCQVYSQLVNIEDPLDLLALCFLSIVILVVSYLLFIWMKRSELT